ncbi:MAG: ComEC/Rec2 family competence protein, partial [Sphingobium sp.]
VMLGTGILAWFVLPTRLDWVILIGLSLAGAAMLLSSRAAQGRLGQAAGVALLRVAAGCILPWGKAVLVGGRVLARPATVRMDAVIERVEEMPGRGLVRIVVRPEDRPDLPARARINIAMADIASTGTLHSGDRLRLRARLMPPASPDLPGGYDYARRAWFDGIGATGRLVPPFSRLALGERPGLMDGAGVRQRLTSHVASRTDGPPGALAITMATGDRGRITPEVEDAMRQSGLSHLLSISGVHVTALIGGVIFLVYRLMALSPRLALRLPLLLISAAAGAGAGIGYTLLTGAEVPTIRSCATALLVMAGLALGREAISLRLLACGALLVMCLWPEAVVGPSFQLSFMAVTAIVALYEHPRIRKFVQAREEPVAMRAARFLGGLFLTGVAVELALMPIALYHFHRTGLLGALANMIAIPLTEFVIMPVEAMALILDIGGMGAPAWWLVQQAMTLLLALAHLVAAQNGAVALTPAIPPTAFALTMGGMLWYMLWRTRLRFVGVAAIAIGLSGYLLAPEPDILVSADGRHVAVRSADGGVALLRDRAGDYMRGQMAEQAAFAGNLTALADLPEARCSEDFCTVQMRGNQVHGRARTYHILMARSRLSVPWPDLIRACTAADIVIADRRLPPACRARWLTLDRADRSRFGGASITLADAAVRRSRDPDDQHPWALPALANGPFQRARH